MELFDKLYDENEKVQVRFVGFTTEDTRYDFGIVHTNMFFGKPLIVCMQTGRSALLDPADLDNIEYLQATFHIKETKQAADLAEFFQSALPITPLQPQYE